MQADEIPRKHRRQREAPPGAEAGPLDRPGHGLDGDRLAVKVTPPRPLSPQPEQLQQRNLR